MSDYARNLDTYNDEADEEPCEFCGTHACICPFGPFLPDDAQQTTPDGEGEAK